MAQFFGRATVAKKDRQPLGPKHHHFLGRLSTGRNVVPLCYRTTY